MRNIFTILLLAITSLSFAEGSKGGAYAMLYMQSIMLPPIAEFCGEKIPGYGKSFNTEFTVWKKSLEEEISQGKSFLDELDNEQGKDTSEVLERKIESGLAQLRKQKIEQIKNTCNRNLNMVRYQNNKK